MTMKSKLAKGAAACAVTVGVLGAGAGVAAADPGQDNQPNNPVPQQQDGTWQQNRHDGDRNDNRDQRDNGGDRHDDRNQDAPAQHGFWFFGTWIPLP